MPEQVHPLLLYPVTQCILGKLKFEDLQAVRQVCSAWNSEANSYLLHRTKITIRGGADLEKFKKEIDPELCSFFPRFILRHTNLENENSKYFFQNFGYHITKLKLSVCKWSSVTLRRLIFEQLPNLEYLIIKTKENSSISQDLLLPMSFGINYPHTFLPKLKVLSVIGDFSNRTDFFYDLIKCSPNLESIMISKYAPEQDELFGTWFTEIILSSELRSLQCLELDCSLIEQHIETLLLKLFPLRRLCLNLGNIHIETIHQVLHHFTTLESVELGIDDAPDHIIQSILNCYPEASFWIAIHTKINSKIVFPKHLYVLEY